MSNSSSLRSALIGFAITAVLVWYEQQACDSWCWQPLNMFLYCSRFIDLNTCFDLSSFQTADCLAKLSLILNGDIIMHL